MNGQHVIGDVTTSVQTSRCVWLRQADRMAAVYDSEVCKRYFRRSSKGNAKPTNAGELTRWRNLHEICKKKKKKL
jgi:hypothetical protein